MRRPAVALLLLVGTPAFLASQSDSVAAPVIATAPVFHAGQWAARFELGGSPYGPTFFGVGALRFTSSHAAWTTSLSLNSAYQEVGFPAGSGDRDLVLLRPSLGRRWYGSGHSRVRPFGEVGVAGLFARGRTKAGSLTMTARTFGGGAYGGLGAAAFLTPELSLGAVWTAGVNAFQRRDYFDGTLVGKRTSFDLGAGTIQLEGTFYF
jgi:hypothetical protein